MVTPKDVRKIALSLPDTEEREHWQRPSFRVKSKIFATLWETEQRAVLKLTLELQTTLVASDPETFFLTGWEHQGWTGVQLTNIDPEQFKKLMIAAWKNVAPKRVAAAYDG